MDEYGCANHSIRPSQLIAWLWRILDVRIVDSARLKMRDSWYDVNSKNEDYIYLEF